MVDGVVEPLTLGIDFGTSAVKTVAMTAGGRVEAAASAPYPTDRPGPARAEQAPADWWAALVSTCRAVLVQVAPARIAAIGLSGQLNGIVLLDGQGEVLRPALIWLDQRCDAELAELEAAFGPGLADLTGSAASPIAVLPKLRWLMRHEPGAMARTRHVLQVKDYILWRLTGEVATEANEASATLMLALGSRSWAPGLVAFAGIDPAVLPPLRPSGAVAGRLTPAAARETGLPEGTRVVPGAGDTGALALGCGAYAPGVAAVTLGTAGHVVAAVPNRPPGAVPGLWRMAHVTDDRELWLGLIPSGGLSIAWLRDLFAAGSGQRPSFEAIEAMAAAAPPGAGGLTFLPFLEGAGTPWNRPDVRASFTGLSPRHGAGEMARAVYEGVAFNLRAAIGAIEAAGVPVERIHLAEGGARSALWCQIIADVLERDVHVVAQGDTSATGAAILAHGAISHQPLAELVAGAVRFDRTFRPDPSARAACRAARQRFAAEIDRLLRRP